MCDLKFVKNVFNMPALGIKNGLNLIQYSKLIPSQLLHGYDKPLYFIILKLQASGNLWMYGPVSVGPSEKILRFSYNTYVICI